MENLENLLNESFTKLGDIYMAFSETDNAQKENLLDVLITIKLIKLEFSKNYIKKRKKIKTKRTKVFKIENKNEVLKVAYYLSQYGYSKLINTTANIKAYEQIANQLNVKVTTLKMLMLKFISLTTDKYPALRDNVDSGVKDGLEKYSNISENMMFEEVKQILKL